MYEKIFKTFISEDTMLEENISKWLKDNSYREIARSAPSLVALNSNSTLRTLIVAVTVTADKYVGN